MNWIRISEHEYVNEDQLRNIQFVKKGTSEYFYRLFYSSGSNTDIKGFDSLEDAFEHANRTFGLEKPIEKPVIKVKTKK
jgi:hypothetical protein